MERGRGGYEPGPLVYTSAIIVVGEAEQDEDAEDEDADMKEPCSAAAGPGART